MNKIWGKINISSIKGKGFMVYFYVCFMIIALLGISYGVLVISTTSGKMKTQVIAKNQEILSCFQRESDTIFKGFEDASKQILVEVSKELLHEEIVSDKLKEAYKNFKIIHNIRAIESRYGNKFSCYVFSETQNKIYSSSIARGTKEFYDEELSENNFSYIDFLKYIKNKEFSVDYRIEELHRYQTHKDYFLYSSNLNNYGLKAIILGDMNVLTRDLHDIDLFKAYDFVMYNQRSEHLTNLGPVAYKVLKPEDIMQLQKQIDLNDILQVNTKLVDEDNLIINLVQSQVLTDFLYISTITKSNAFSSITTLEKKLLRLLDLFLVLCASFSLYLARKSGSPLENIVRELDDLENKVLSKGVFKRLTHYVDLIQRENEKNKLLISRHEIIIMEYFFISIIEGVYKENNRAEEILEEKMCFNKKNYFVLLELNYSERRNANTENCIKDFVNKKMTDGFFAFNLGKDIGRILLIISDKSKEELLIKEQNLIKEVTSLKEVRMMHFIQSAIVNDYSNLKICYQQVKYLSCLEKKQKFISWEDLTNEGGSYFFRKSEKNKLKNFVITGNKIEIEELLDEIYNENLVKKQVSMNMTLLLFEELKLFGIQLIDELDVGDENEKVLTKLLFLDITKKIAFLDKIIGLKEGYIKLAKMYTSKGTKQPKAIEKIMTHIEKEIFNPSLSAKKVACDFDMGYQKFLSYFKENIGLSFQNYIERERIIKAKKLLLNSQKTVTKISEACGYNSTRTFHRSFKKIVGITPKEYIHLKAANATITDDNKIVPIDKNVSI